MKHVGRKKTGGHRTKFFGKCIVTSCILLQEQQDNARDNGVFRFKNIQTSTIFPKLGPLIQGAESNKINQKNCGVTGHIRKMEDKEVGKCPILLTGTYRWRGFRSAAYFLNHNRYHGHNTSICSAEQAGQESAHKCASDHVTSRKWQKVKGWPHCKQTQCQPSTRPSNAFFQHFRISVTPCLSKIFRVYF